jgi:hypothetical protein
MLGSNPDPVPLRDDSLGVSLETTPRKIQDSSNNGYYVTLNRDWLAQVDLAEQSAATLHSFSSGMSPVIVRNPAIIVQPAAVIEEGETDG